MNLLIFIHQNKREIEAHINRVLYPTNLDKPDPPPRYDNEQLRQWIMNDEMLYKWAKESGCRI